MGIFSKCKVIETPENVFHNCLQRNPFYPFQEVQPKVLMYSVKLGRSVGSVMLCVLTLLIAITIFTYLGEMNEYIVFFMLIFIAFLGDTMWAWKKRTYVLDCNEKMYEFYIGDNLIYRGDFHNVYIRCKCEKSGTGEVYYTVVLDGYNLDEEVIASTSTNRSLMSKYGKRLARRLTLNYFDPEDVSKGHIILHRCPYETGNCGGE